MCTSTHTCHKNCWLQASTSEKSDMGDPSQGEWMLRCVAASLYEMHKHDIHQAVRQFKQCYPDSGITDVAGFIHRWHGHVVNDGSLTDHKHPGRARTLSDEELDACCEAFKQGYQIPTTDGTGHIQMFFTSIQHALAHSSVLRRTLQQHSLTAGTLLSNMLAHDSNLVKKTQHFKRGFTNAEKRLRAFLAVWFLALNKQFPRWNRQVVWMDEGTICFAGQSGSHRVYCDKGDLRPTLVVEDARFNSGHPITVRFAIAVSGEVGPAHIEFLSGTTHREFSPHWHKVHGPAKDYTVSRYPTASSSCKGVTLQRNAFCMNANVLHPTRRCTLQ
jgi:hypothetical protein